MAEANKIPSAHETIAEEPAVRGNGASTGAAKNSTEAAANGTSVAAAAVSDSEGAVGGTAAATENGTDAAGASSDALVKHPLQNKWTFWYYDNEKGKPWEDCQHRIATFETAEDFWCLYNTIKQPTEIPNGNDYSLFKNDIRPMWEDDQNKNGGRWIINLQRAVRNATLDELWLDVVLCVIGEAFEFSDDVCGIVVNIRPRGPKIAVWTTNSIKERVIGIGEKLRESLKLPKGMVIQFELHKDTAFKPGGKGVTYML